MNHWLVLSAGQTDVQLLLGSVRQELDKRHCAALHKELEERVDEWTFGESTMPKVPGTGGLSDGPFQVCTPKLDAVLRYLDVRCAPSTRMQADSSGSGLSAGCTCGRRPCLRSQNATLPC